MRLRRSKLPLGIGHPNRGLRFNKSQCVSRFRLCGDKPFLQGAGLQPRQLELPQGFTQPIYLTLGSENLPLMMQLPGSQPLLGSPDLGRKILDPRLLGPAARSGDRQFLAGRLEDSPGGFKLGVTGGAFLPLLNRRQNGDALAILEGQ